MTTTNTPKTQTPFQRRVQRGVQAAFWTVAAATFLLAATIDYPHLFGL